jgi:hypothetical protein
MKAFLKTLLTDFRFWLLVFFAIRLIGITNPPLEIGHSWRQVTGLMVARNFAEVDSDIRFPRIDDNQGGTGIIGMEFPVLNYLHYTMGYVLGQTNWYGRLINLLVSSLGLWFFYSLVLKVFQDPKLAFTAGLVLSASSWFAYSRKTMPDTFCISLIIIALYYAIQYLETQKTLNLLLYILLTTLATLSKIPAAMYLVFLMPLSLNSNYQIKPRLILLFFTVIPISLTYYWYYLWNPYLEATYGNWYNIGKPLLIGFKELVENPKQTLDNFYFDAFTSFSMFGLFVAGLFLVIYNKEILIIKLFALFAFIFAIYMIKSGFYFYHHSYYILPMVPFMALISAYTLVKIQKRWVYIAFIVIGIGEGIANQQHDFFIKPSEMYKTELEALADKVSTREERIIINGNNNPQLMYFAHRKGWNCYDHELADTSYLYQAKRKGCKLVIVNKHGCESRPPLKLIIENDDFAVFRY